MNRTSKTTTQMEEIEEIKEFLGHIQPRVGESAFAQIWETVERLENRLNKSDCISSVSDRFDDAKFIDNVCLSYAHDFGLMSEEDRETQRFLCKEWMRAIKNNEPYDR